MKCKSKDEIKQYIVCIISLLMMVGGTIYGIGITWVDYAVVIPFGWGIIGIFLDELINGKHSSRNAIYSVVLITFLITNLLAILFKIHDTKFIIGRVICCLGGLLLLISAIGDIDKKSTIE